VSEQKLKALPLPVFARLLTSTISSTFKAGTFLSSAPASVIISPQHQAHIPVCPAESFTTNYADAVIYLAFNPSCTDLAINVVISADNVHSINIEAYSQSIGTIDRISDFVTPE
jgi:hypothetical protein